MLIMSRFRSILASTVLVALALSLFSVDAQAQYWRKKAQVIAPVDPGTPTIALLDTLVSYIEDQDSLKVRRSPEDPKMYSASELQDELLDQHSIAMTSASNVFIDYQFDLNRSGFSEKINALQFIFRSQGTAEDDISIMYVNAKRQDWLTRILTQKGTTGENLMALSTFRDQLSFPRVVRNMNAKITRIGNEAVRDGFESKKDELVREITQLTYQSR